VSLPQFLQPQSFALTKILGNSLITMLAVGFADRRQSVAERAFQFLSQVDGDGKMHVFYPALAGLALT